MCAPRMADRIQAVVGRTHRSAPTKGNLVSGTWLEMAMGEIYAGDVFWGGHIGPPLDEHAGRTTGQFMQALETWLSMHNPRLNTKVPPHRNCSL